MRVLYPGSFDPLTNGHLDLIERGVELFGEVVVAVLHNTDKVPTFSLEKRVHQIQQSTKHLRGVEIVSFEGLTVDCAKDEKCTLILRGLRALSDFEYELQLAHTNRSLACNTETVFLATTAHHSFLSSSVVKEVAKFGGNISHLVPEIVANELKLLFNK
ncbi:pantetheine-phosphate adenylyltransferase [Prochlorococcus sp. MIT 1341]|uniref:pantetheine-phosphate adenylyltransferase n=1 Tax=Prochlorococcus sp. MIT 1341 TaxID=3096221 RepID=UPI002A759BA3|nr:pantetheine-phosphate adenylyltransferase [Prochlorococcus sp. MIT 1341]